MRNDSCDSTCTHTILPPVHTFSFPFVPVCCSMVSAVLQAAHPAAQHLWSLCRAFRSCDGPVGVPRTSSPFMELTQTCPHMEQMNQTRGSPGDSTAVGKVPGLTQLLGKNIPWELSRSARGCSAGARPSRSRSSTHRECKGLQKTKRVCECWLWKAACLQDLPHDKDD